MNCKCVQDAIRKVEDRRLPYYLGPFHPNYILFRNHENSENYFFESENIVNDNNQYLRIFQHYEIDKRGLCGNNVKSEL